MSKRKQTKAIQKVIYKLCRQLWKLVQTAALGFSQWLMRTFIILGRKKRRPASGKAGFVLPTVTLLLLVVSLVIGAILFRTGSRTNQVIADKEAQVIYNAATPAIERAKAKLEYLFSDKEADRRPSGIPSDEVLLSMLLNDQNQYYRGMVNVKNPDPYTLPDEQPGRLDINNDGKPDPAWAYEQDVDNDGKKEKIVYSILFRRRNENTPMGPTRIEDNNELRKSLGLVVRNGPINTIDISNSKCASVVRPGSPPTSGTPPLTDPSVWETVSTATLRKTFQVDAIVISNQEGTSRTVATLEFQQDREINRGNRWGAWFRNDLEIFPGGPFNWNGAMYTAGNLFVGNGGFRGFLISAPGSCFYKDASSSEIVVSKDDPEGFQGQIVAGRLGNNDFNGNGSFDVKNPNGAPNQNRDQNRLKADTDSVARDNPADIALDPVKILTEDKSESRIPVSNNPIERNNRNRRDPAWDNDNETPGQIGYLKTRGRIVNRNEETPFVDDTYRADDRYGPKPRYKEIKLNNSDKKNGMRIQPADQAVLTRNTTDALDTEFRNLGLDGYWERRAWANGFRVIVGERLELGNAFGWNRDLNGNGSLQATEIEPLYPADDNVTTNLQKQRKTWRDNLAAVQGTAVYHIANPNAPNPAERGDFPVACLATTAHPGTQGTINNSKNFWVAGDRYPVINNNRLLYSDFLTGLGTNGWEYQAPPNDVATNGDWRNALFNLANFAGDYQDDNNSGAFPPTQGGRVYPHSYLTMWGNLSNLRRALKMPEGERSIADRSYIHTAACTMGMLAYNVNYFSTSYGSIPNIVTLQTKLQELFTKTTGNRIQINAAGTEATIYRTQQGGSETSRTVPVTQLTPEDYIGLLPADQDLLKTARFVAMKEQIERDRENGFAPSVPTASQTIDPPDRSSNDTNPAFQVACDNSTIGGDNRPDILRVLCPSQPKYPSLYYLFPSQTRGDRQIPGNPNNINSSEPYIQQTGNAGGLDNGGFQTVNPNTIALQPKNDGAWTGCNTGAWCLPTNDSAGTGNGDDFQITLPSGSGTNRRFVSIIDNALFNSREMMTVRTLDIDLNLLRRNNSIGDNSWFPTSGIVYAFREDAVREDAIARPAGGNMNATGSNPTDPGLEANGLSRKAVDFYPDPDRRPHGFRLRNGKDLRRGDDNPRGLTFVSDNPVYIQGDFNYHSTDGNSNNLEEFTQTLNNDWGNFYDRTNLEERFARLGAGRDTWRPSEILADAITIVSDKFEEGSLDRGIQSDTSNNPNRYSFLAMNAPNNSNPGGWVLEDGTILKTSSPSEQRNIPIKISRNGHPLYCSTGSAGDVCTISNLQEYNQGYRDIAFGNAGGFNYRENAINEASDTRINTTIISGIVPSRQFQSYGGFHNFPRFIEKWYGKNLSISGSFVQLNFSSYATAPFEQQAWEPGQNPNPTSDSDAESIRYYGAPRRSWGYDVGLQYAPAGPAAQRLISSSSSRSEFYRDLKADDPYICRLRRGFNARNQDWDRPSQSECPNNL